MSGAALWTGEAFAAAVGGRVIGTLPQNITGVSIDSRSIKPGEAFFAITGDKMDGHDYARSALDNLGSIAVICEKRAPRLGRVAPAIAVDDVLAALTRLAVAARARSEAKI
jgi:UDP-N-acetylmuramoyl-tripeptide--D-alanyl-D-alanine ligase